MKGSLTLSLPVSTWPAYRFVKEGFSFIPTEKSYHPKLLPRFNTIVSSAVGPIFFDTGLFL
jgi:hypothetical protein